MFHDTVSFQVSPPLTFTMLDTHVACQLQNKPKWTHYLKRTLAVLVIFIGLFLFVNGFIVLFVSGESA